jgi:hypothetical protein
MSTQTTPAAIAIDRLGVGDKREQLRGLSDLVWDIEDHLAQVKAARARLMAGIQEDLRRQAA